MIFRGVSMAMVNFPKRKWIGIGLLLAAGVAAGAAGAGAPSASPQEILDFVEETADWYRHVMSVSTSSGTPEEALFHDAVLRNADNGLKLGFSFGKAEAGLVGETAGGPTTAASQPSRLATAAAAANQRVAELSARLDAVNRELSAATEPAPQTLAALRDKLSAELSLAKTRQQVIADFAGFSGGSAEGLAQKIDDLQKALTPGPTNAAGAAASAGAQRPETTGLFGLVGQLLSLTGQTHELQELDHHTATLAAENERLRGPLRAELMAAIRQGDELYKAPDGADAAALAQQRREIDALSAKYKLLTAAAVPLAEQMQVFDACRGNLRGWRQYADTRYGQVLRALILRAGGIATAILILLAVSALWRRAAFRYITDVRRQRQFLLVRRLVVGAIIIAILVTGAVSEFSSLATFAGLITAGVAVALQTVILSGVAHFFFIGRYGVRVGDRVTISGITGDVIDMGIIRLYLMELTGNGRDLSPTGRVVVFSNAVLFQPSAFFKQLPGAEYVWHEMALTLALDTDSKLAETRLMDVVKSVVDQYRQQIQEQYAALRYTMHLPVPEPEPRGRMRFVESGVEYVVRYPVEIHRAAEIDDQITRRLVEAIAREPKLKLVGTGTPQIQPAQEN